jgi:hypothetical protein
MLHHAHRGRFILVVAQLDLEALVDPAIRIRPLHLLALAHDIECIARVHADRFILCRVDLVLAGEFQLPVLVAAVETLVSVLSIG